ncbi:NADH dehydrogenase subunit G [Nitrosospira multiformis ATCC 25196]|uniref:NADH-quinone oxidoreductase n=1 Tax=Nitrosospira multiformis (strain ATCC 25196 / NCIMB 11849 / C 71) TaxID=323848 RepID=Q2YAA0_NITMU|nr:NADH-quinone oxidoreductase subunit NuoG [Nitrosospira multiformis]ABB74321.1 NADH dehydrogenase subunit G [Nitrosospira multiformis ATCC 25196]SEF50248.1 NADH dehydrogenase subunit G [Nitrosospira multiformis ATCC 25196]
MTTIHIDNRPYPAKEGENLLQECLSLGFNLPYFCWHPALGSVGACRQCAIKQFKNEEDKHGKIVMACMTAAKDGIRISIDDPEAQEFRASVAEWLMVNHPHDCPVCDEGGECHLQDMTVMNGHVYRRYHGRKRTFHNQDLGPLVNHEMNRCIQCYRCTRFYREYAGGRDLDALVLRNQVYFGRHQDGVLENEFSGNLVEVCPTGVFTDKTLKRHYTRKWDLQTAPSVCVHCGLGCNTIPGERYGMLRRIRNRFNGAVNGYFLCDRGRYGYEFVNSRRRIRQPLLRKNRTQPLQPASKRDALQHLGEMLSGRARAIGIGSPRASLEANFALRALVGGERFYLGISERDSRLLASVLDILKKGPARTPSLHEVELADAVLVLGEDVANTAPRLGLALRQSVRRQPEKMAKKTGIPLWNDHAVREAMQEEHGPLFIATLANTRLDDIATRTFRGPPAELARLGLAIAHALDPIAPQVPGLSDTAQTLADAIAEKLKAAERPLVISGIGCGDKAIVEAAANVTWALCNLGRPAELCYVVPECNSLGATMLGGGSLETALEAMNDAAADILVILENDLYRRADAALVDRLLAVARHIVMIDHIEHATSAKADVVLPAAAFAEADGTLVNNEGRAQRFFQVFVPKEEIEGDIRGDTARDIPGDIQESWRWIRDIMLADPGDEGQWSSLDDVTAACAAAIPSLEPILRAAPSAAFRMDGQKIPRESHRYSGRTAMNANVSIHEPEQPQDPDTALAFSMEGYPGHPPPSLIPRFWAPGWNSIQALNKFQDEVGGALSGGDPGERLIEPMPQAGKKAAYFENMPAGFEPRADEWLLLPLHHIFGSEELSILAPGIAELGAQPYLALNPEDADALELAAGDEVQLRLKAQGDAQVDVTREDSANTAATEIFRLPLRFKPELLPGTAGLPVGLTGMGHLAGVVLPAWGELKKV